MAPWSEIAATKLRLALLKSLCNPGAQPSWLWGWRASCPPTKEQSNRQDACLPHRLEAYAPAVPKLFNKAKPRLRCQVPTADFCLPRRSPAASHEDQRMAIQVNRRYLCSLIS